MRKLALIAVVAVGLGGCAQLQAVSAGIDIASKSAANPVTREDLYKFESAFSVAITLLDTYKRACLQGAADVNCKSNIRTIQPYTRQIPPYLAQLRSFVKQNDQVNAGVVYNQLTTLYTNMRATATALGVNLGA